VGQKHLVAASVIAALTVLGACTAASPHPAVPEQHPASPRVYRQAAGPAKARALLAREGLLVPSTYQQACAGPASVGCLNTPPGPIPAVLNRPLHFPVLRPRRHCPASPGRTVTIGDDTGTEQGNGPIRVLTGASRHGVASLLAHTNAPPWLGLKTTWFSVPAYQGPFVIRATRLGRPGPVSQGGLPPVIAPLVVPPGPTITTVPRSNGRPGYREVITALSVRSAGCYAWQVDGLRFSEIIVIRAVLR
jgi:hypothetical protein